MRKYKLFAILTALILISGCASNEEMRKKFENGKMWILVDSNGNEYLVSHAFGDNYYVRPYKPEEKDFIHR